MSIVIKEEKKLVNKWWEFYTDSVEEGGQSNPGGHEFGTGFLDADKDSAEEDSYAHH